MLLKRQGIGHCISSMFLGCILYADDILLLSPTVAGLQKMLDKCSEIAEVISLEFNVEKAHCIVIGKIRNGQITPMSLCGKLKILLNGVKPLNILACICKVAVLLGLMSVMLKEHFTLHAMPFFYIVIKELTRLHCYIYKKPTVFQYLCMLLLP